MIQKRCIITRNICEWQEEPVSNLIIIIIIQFIKCLRLWLQRHWQQVSRGCCSKALWKKYVLSLVLKWRRNEREWTDFDANWRKARALKGQLLGSGDQRSRSHGAEKAAKIPFSHISQELFDLAGTHYGITAICATTSRMLKVKVIRGRRQIRT